MSKDKASGNSGKAAPKPGRTMRKKASKGSASASKKAPTPTGGKPSKPASAKTKPATTETTPAKPVEKRNRKKSSSNGDTWTNASTSATDSRLPEQRVELIRITILVRWRDLDAFNHVNNAKYLGYLEEARLQWMMGLPGQWIDDNVAPVLAAAHVNYRRPIQWPGEVVVEQFVERVGNTSLTIGHRIVDAHDASVLYADGNVVMVWIDRQDGKTAVLPETVREACASD